ncbi:MAG: tRNA pseudouridine(55) synthase TruB [Pseudomonadota bacterium]
MARKRTGQPIHGWLIIDKPSGVTSSTVVNKLRWLLNAQKAGHAGTLDPDATGLLAVAFGEATKTIPYLTDALKTYRFTIVFGAATSTDDASGEVIACSDMRPSEEAISDALGLFRGEIMQVPPQVSAVKVDGARAYDLAREGEVMDLEARPLFVETLELIAFDGAVAEVQMTCGKGGYVRSIARDLGEALGTKAHVGWLRRLQSGPFDLEGAIPFANWAETDREWISVLENALRPAEAAMSDFPTVQLGPDAETKVRNGNTAQVLSSDAQNGDIALAFANNVLVAIGEYQSGLFKPSRVLNQ